MMQKPDDIVIDRARVREVVGVFHSWTSLKAAGDALRLAGVDRSDIDVIAPPDEVRRKLGSASAYIPAEEMADMPGVPRQPLFADDDAAYEAILDQVTSDRVKTHFGSLVHGPVERFEARNVLALKFVMHDALGGGAPRSLRADNLGKTLGAALLRMEIDVPAPVATNASRQRAPITR